MRKILLSKKFTRQIEEVLVPLFNEHGFIKRTLEDYSRYIKPYIHCINLQTCSDTKEICINLGIHLDFLHVSGKLEIPKVEDVREIDCCIRRRLTPQAAHDCWWPAEPAEKQVLSMRELFKIEGITFFDKYTKYPDIFLEIEVEDVRSGKILQLFPGYPNSGSAILLAQIYENIGDKKKAIEFSEYGLECLKEGNPRLTRLSKKVLKDIINRCSL